MRKPRPGADPSIDPRGLIFEAYRIEGISSKDCRTILLDWALGMPDGSAYSDALRQLHSIYCTERPDHPMTAVIEEGLVNSGNRKRKRGRHTSRRRQQAGEGSD